MDEVKTPLLTVVWPEMRSCSHQTVLDWFHFMSRLLSRLFIYSSIENYDHSFEFL